MRPLQKLQLLGIAFVNNGDGLHVIYRANEVNGASDATKESVDKDLNRNTLVFRSVAKNKSFYFTCRIRGGALSANCPADGPAAAGVGDQ